MVGVGSTGLMTGLGLGEGAVIALGRGLGAVIGFGLGGNAGRVSVVGGGSTGSDGDESWLEDGAG